MTATAPPPGRSNSCAKAWRGRLGCAPEGCCLESRPALHDCGRNSFKEDYGTSFTPEQIAAGEPLYNFGTTPGLGRDIHGTTIFARDAAGRIFHTYSCFARGNEVLAGAFAWLDMTPKGRNETSTMNWVRLHDEYEATPHPGAACCG